MKRLLSITGLLLLFTAEILRVYFISPFPGSQHENTIDLAYWISNNIIWIRILALALIIFPLVYFFKNGKKWTKVAMSLGLILYGLVFFFFNYRFEADKMFYQPKHKLFAAANNDTTDRGRLVMGVVINGQAKAYPIQIIGYHHQVMDTIGNTAVMITYCTVCRTGRAFSPFIKGSKQTFTLVGMDHYNAMFKDAATGSWWQQATGKVVAGPLKGAALTELPSKQLTLAAWLREYPNSYIMQPDASFKRSYGSLANYDKGTLNSSLEKRDLSSWQRKSWVIGVVHMEAAKAYDWNQLVKAKVINDAIEDMPVLVTLENDTVSFHVYNRLVNGTTLDFERGDNDLFIDRNTHSTWNMDGICISGAMKGEKLNSVQSYQEFWHSWSTFHPNTKKYDNLRVSEPSARVQEQAIAWKNLNI